MGMQNALQTYQEALLDLVRNRKSIAETSAERMAEDQADTLLPLGPMASGQAKPAAPQRLTPTDAVKLPKISMSKVLWRTLLYWRPYALLVVPLLLLMLIQEGYNILYTQEFKCIIEILDGQISRQCATQGAAGHASLFFILVLLAIGYTLSIVAGVIANLITARVGSSILNDLRLKLFKHMQHLPMSYFASVRTGDLISRFTSDLSEIDKGMTDRFADGLQSLVGLALFVPYMLILNWEMGLFVFAVLPLISVGNRLIAPRASGAFAKLKQEQSAFASAVQENIRTQPIIKLFGLYGYTLRRLRVQLRDLYDRSVAANYLSQLVGTTSTLGVRLVQLIVIGGGAYFAFYVPQAHLRASDLVAFIAALANVSAYIYNLSKKVTPSLIAAGSGVQRIDEFLAVPVTIRDAPNARPLEHFSRQIEFRHVTFGYPGKPPTLYDAHLTIHAGEFVAFVGPTGAGKSTIINLLTRFYDPRNGLVLLDGQEIREITEQSLHHAMSVVFQEPILFNTTLRENIRLGKPDATEEDIIRAAQAAELHDFIMQLPDRYETNAGEQGAMLSGGQKQRISIARALVRNPRILLLDEATSALDPATEAAINETILRLAQDRTVISVTHRLAGIQHADQIFVVRDGIILEKGRHEALLRKNGAYASLWNIQVGIPDPERRADVPAPVHA